MIVGMNFDFFDSDGVRDSMDFDFGVHHEMHQWMDLGVARPPRSVPFGRRFGAFDDHGHVATKAEATHQELMSETFAQQLLAGIPQRFAINGRVQSEKRFFGNRERVSHRVREGVRLADSTMIGP